ncbi:MAG: DUF1572 family protein [Candidatus Hydrogenedentota bacterium]
MSDDYLTSLRKMYAFYRMLGDKTIAQVSDEELFWQYHENANSIGVLVQHISGNLLSRFTDFLTSDGEKDWRDRDSEFERCIDSREELIAAWDEGWKCLFAATDPLTDDDLEKIVYIRNEGHSVTEALNRSMAHCAYHVGQIVQIGVMLRGDDWETLSVARGQSKARNEAMFSQPRRRANFTDGLIDKE